VANTVDQLPSSAGIASESKIAGTVPPPPIDAPPKDMGASSHKILPGNSFTVVVERVDANSRLGLDTVARRRPPALKVKKIKAGLIQGWNEANPTQQVEEEDVITDVNGECSDIEKMYGVIGTGSTLTLTVYRPTPEEIATIRGAAK